MQLSNDNNEDNNNIQNSTNKKIYNVDEEIPERKINIPEEAEIEEEEDKIIINYENENMEKNDIPKIKQNNNNKFLYIPYSSIDDQIVDRKVNINSNNSSNSNSNSNNNDIEKHNKKIKTLTRGENSRPYIKKRVDNKNVTISSNHHSKNTLSLNIKNDKMNDMIKERENEIVNNVSDKKEETKIKRYKNEKKIFIPECAIEDQIIKREVISEINQTI